MTSQERFAELWTDYLEGDLDDGGLEALRTLIAADEELLSLAANLYQTHHLLGLVSDGTTDRQDRFVAETLARVPQPSAGFVRRVMADVAGSGGGSPGGRDAERLGDRAVVRPSRGGGRRAGVSAAVGVAVLAVAVWANVRRSPSVPPGAEENGPTVTRGAGTPVAVEARFTSLAGARFFGELLPEVGSTLAPRRDYALLRGLVEVGFPSGATAILEGPAVFRVLSNECLALDMGRCSVHAPAGAEGFRVETPVTRVVDRGTRFMVSVSETSATEVQVVEGAADVYQQLEPAARAPEPEFRMRLESARAHAFANVGAFSSAPLPFDAAGYRARLPDRVISYEVTTDEAGGALDLTSILVQRGGARTRVAVDELIPIEVTSFTGRAGHALIASDGGLSRPRRRSLADMSLQTGLINPDGSREPLTADPVTVAADSVGGVTPGLAVRFVTPVVNGPGPDVVLFELQAIGYPPDGDAFHVSPLRFRDGLRSHTVRVYDVTLESPESLPVAPFHIHVFGGAIASLEDLETRDHASRHGGSRFRGLVVGIDLSDLGYGVGERVAGLFIQDALDDQHHVDPVFIAGLPAVSEVQEESP